MHDERNLSLPSSRSMSPASSSSSTPQRNKIIQPTTMTVSVTHPQKLQSQNSIIMALSTAATERPLSPASGNSSGSDNDPLTNSPSSTTALRRLYFKSGRSAKTKAATTVPKVVVMGSSTASASETTINTSTESASTLVTSVTATDTSEACDSLDMGDNYGQNEPLLSSLDEPQASGGSNESEQDVTELELTSAIRIGTGNDNRSSSFYQKNTSIIENIESSLTTLSSKNQHQQQSFPITSTSSTSPPSGTNSIPRTAPAVSSSVHFPFDPPQSPKSVRTIEKDQNLFTFKEAAVYLEQQKRENEKLDKHELKQFAYSKQQQNKNYNRDINDFDDGNEIKMNWNDNGGKENRKHKNKNLHQSNNGFRSCSDDNDSIKDDYIKGRVRQHQRQLQDKLEINEINKDIRREIKLKSKNNRYMNTTSPKKERGLSSNQNKINSAKDKFFGVQKHTISNGPNSNYDYDRKDLTMFPFDREAIDYDRIQRECFAIEDDSKFQYDMTTDSESDSNDASVYERKTFGSPLKSSKNDIFQQYTLLSQQETYYSHERRHSKRSRPDLIHTKYDHIAKSDAFSPKPIDSSSTPKPPSELHKFEQIASKFEQIPPKHDTNNTSFHHFHGSNNNLSINSISTSQTMLNNGNQNSVGGNGGNLVTMSRATPPLPDLRVDFFTENAPSTSTMHQQQQQQQHHQQQSQHDILDECQKLHPTTGAINVTANPMETAVCTQPRATIVVQQPSLSLDNTVETLLLKNEGDFVSVEQAKESRKKKQRREENMRQLLDVTNTLTFEELRDFEMRYGSPHHSRSQSVKTPGSRASGRPNQLSLPQQRSRVASMPNTGVEEEYYRLRHFSITGKGVVNRGDSLKSRRSRSNNSVASSNSSTEHLTANAVPVVGSAKTSATCSLASSRESSTSNPGNGPYRVLMLGSAAVGKSSLVSQFMTSEYLHAYDTSIDDESGEKSVSVLLSGEESELIFIDHAYSEMSPENCLSSYDPHGYCVIYSSADRSSFIVAERVLQALWTTENIAQKAVILVGNKADLARSRVVTSDEGKAMATAYDCKFIETSVGINHNVDELLVGLLSQIRLKLENPEKSRDLFRKRSSRKSKRRACSPLGGAATACLTGNGGTNPSTPLGPPTSLISEFGTPPGSVHSSPRKYRGSRTSASLKVKGLLGRVWARDSKSKSCENLHVL